MILLILLISLVLFYSFSKKTKSADNDNGSWKVYGTMGCGWTRKQLDHLKSNGVSYTFVNCDSEECSVDAFPTLIHSQSGEKIVGYTEKLSA